MQQSIGHKTKDLRCGTQGVRRKGRRRKETNQHDKDTKMMHWLLGDRNSQIFASFFVCPIYTSEGNACDLRSVMFLRHGAIISWLRSALSVRAPTWRTQRFGSTIGAPTFSNIWSRTMIPQQEGTTAISRLPFENICSRASVHPSYRSCPLSS